MDNLEEVIRKLERDFPLLPYVAASMKFSTVRRMQAEKAQGIPLTRRTGFVISVEHGKPARDLSEEQWEELYAGLAAELQRDYPQLYGQLFP